jgi:thioredoxin reductase
VSGETEGPGRTTGDGVVDVTVVGAGPAGLAAAYYAGHRHASVRILESLDEVGGQLAATYPEKHIYDVAGFPSVVARELVEQLAEQGLGLAFDVRLGEEAEKLETIEEGDERLIRLTTVGGASFLTKALIVTSGHGAFAPRKLPIAGIDAWEGRGLHYAIRRKDELAGKRCLIVGGGDSALDWTLGLAEIAAPPVTLVHRRERFRGLESSLAQIRELEKAGRTRVMAPCELRALHGAERLEAVTVENTSSGERERIACDALITLLGFHSHLGAIADWGLEHFSRRQLRVDPASMRTSRPRVYAAGDVAGYEGKIELITIALAEAAIAANNAVADVRHEKAQPRYSSE